jgi:hypothetical protein
VKTLIISKKKVRSPKKRETVRMYVHVVKGPIMIRTEKYASTVSARKP